MVKLNKNVLSNSWILLAAILLIGVIGSFYQNSSVEGYDNYYKQDTSIKCLEEKKGTLLGDWYALHSPKPQFSDKDMSEQYKNYPTLPINSLYSNNTKYWKTPSNGLCQPPGMCGAFYADREITLDKEPKMPPLTDVVNPRVNYYTSAPTRSAM